eukprot:2850573-Pyramimonas_sp.AAC.1
MMLSRRAMISPSVLAAMNSIAFARRCGRGGGASSGCFTRVMSAKNCCGPAPPGTRGSRTCPV